MLELVAGEGYPTTRLAEATTGVQTHTVDNVTAMGVLVYQIVQQSAALIEKNSDSVASEDKIVSSVAGDVVDAAK